MFSREPRVGASSSPVMRFRARLYDNFLLRPAGRDARHGIQPHIRQAVKLCNIPVAKLCSYSITSTWNVYKRSTARTTNNPFVFDVSFYRNRSSNSTKNNTENKLERSLQSCKRYVTFNLRNNGST